MAGHFMEEKSSCAEGQCQSNSGPAGPQPRFKLTMLETPRVILACMGPGMSYGLATQL